MVAFVGLIGLSLASFSGLGGGSEYKLTAPFDTAAGLFPGSDVLIAGSKVGTVDNIYLRGDQALVTFTIDPAHAPVHSDAKVQLRPKSLLGEKYISLDPGTHGDSVRSGSILSSQAVTR